MDLLRNQVINEHYRLIQQLENKYTEQVNQLLKQKALIHLVLQQTLYTKLLEINDMTETTLNTSNTSNSSPSSSSPLIFPQQRKNVNNQTNNNNVNNNFVQNGDIFSSLKDVKFDLGSNVLLQQLNRTKCNLQNETSAPNHSNASTPTDDDLKCNICNNVLSTKNDYNFHKSMHTLQSAIITQFPENYMNFPSNDQFKNSMYSRKDPKVKDEQSVFVKSETDTIIPIVYQTPIPISTIVPSSKQSLAGMHHIKPFQCTKCGKCFRQKRELNRHIINKHTPNHEKPFKCRFCSYGAATKSIVQRHEFTHSSDKPFKCPHCTYQTSYKYILRKHLKKVHGEDAQNQMFDENKNTQNKTDSNCNNDNSNDDETNPKKWKCGSCDKRFTAKSLKQQHEAIHNGPKEFKCDQCSFETAHKRSLTRHKLLHVQDKPYLCNTCHKKFNSMQDLEQHSKQHITS